MHLIIERMILLLLPSMRELTSVLIFASISISLDKVFSFPLRTLILLVIEDVRLSSKVLPVMSIYASISSVLGITVRAPYSFKVKDIKVWIFDKFITVQ